jgi:hypothetical protein
MFVARTLASLVLMWVVTLAPAAAQPLHRRFVVRPPPPADRGFVSIGAGYQATEREFGDSYTFASNQETGTARLRYPIKAGPTLDLGGGARLWRRIGAGVALGRFVRDGVVAATSSVPHPLYLLQPREVSGEGEGVRREETIIHLQAQYWVPVSRKLHVILMGGPSIVRVTQALAFDVNYTETYPYDAATFGGVDAKAAKASTAGFHAGVDLRWMLTRAVGAGVLVRFARASVDLDASESRTVPVNAGGLQVGAGLRVVF